MSDLSVDRHLHNPCAQRGAKLCTVSVEALEIEASIGIHAHERKRLQPLRIDAAIEFVMGDLTPTSINETIDYCKIADMARKLAAGPHIDLLETFADKLLHYCLSFPCVTGATVTVKKPSAIEGALAGVSIKV